MKNLYVIGTGQARYGFGPLLTPAAELVAQMIQLQEKMELPIGLVMKESGVPLPTTHLVDPHDALRKMKLAKRFLLPRLLRKEKKLRNKMAVPAPPECAPQVKSKAQSVLGRELGEVYKAGLYADRVLANPIASVMLSEEPLEQRASDSLANCELL